MEIFYKDSRNKFLIWRKERQTCSVQSPPGWSFSAYSHSPQQPGSLRHWPRLRSFSLWLLFVVTRYDPPAVRWGVAVGYGLAGTEEGQKEPSVLCLQQGQSGHALTQKVSSRLLRPNIESISHAHCFLIDLTKIALQELHSYFSGTWGDMSIRDWWHPTKSALVSLYKGIRALYRPNTIKN